MRDIAVATSLKYIRKRSNLEMASSDVYSNVLTMQAVAVNKFPQISLALGCLKIFILEISNDPITL